MFICCPIFQKGVYCCDARQHYDLGVNYEKNREFDEAIRELELAVLCKDDYSDAHYILGTLYEKKYKYDAAIKEYKIFLTYKPDHEMASQRLSKLKNEKRAREEIQEKK